MIFIITGERKVGKTTVVERTVTRLRQRGVEVVGVYTVNADDGLDLVDARTGTRRHFATRSPSQGAIQVGRYYIDPDAFDLALESARTPGDVLVVDEIGTLERQGDGFYPILEDLDPDCYRGVLFSVRRGVADFVAETLPPGTDSTTVEVTKRTRDGLPEAIAEQLVAPSDE